MGRRVWPAVIFFLCFLLFDAQGRLFAVFALPATIAALACYYLAFEMKPRR